MAIPDTNEQPSTQEFKELLRSQVLADFDIVCKDGEVLPAHTFILYARSSFFKGLLSSDMKEKHERTVRLEESVDIVTCMLSYIYTKQYEIKSDAKMTHHARMYALGDKYGIHGLRQTALEKFSEAAHGLPSGYCLPSKQVDFFNAVKVIYDTTHDEFDKLRQIVLLIGIRRMAFYRFATRPGAGQESLDLTKRGSWHESLRQVPEYAVDILAGLNDKMGRLDESLLKVARVKCGGLLCGTMDSFGPGVNLVWISRDAAKCLTCGRIQKNLPKAVRDAHSDSQGIYTE